MALPRLLTASKLVALLAAACSTITAPHSAHAITTGFYVNSAGLDEMVAALMGPDLSLVPGSAYLHTDTDGGTGTFGNGLSSIGIDQGVLLTSGTIYNALGPNNTSSKTGAGSFSSLGFSFTTNAPGVSWRYAFASEEYEEYVGSQFNDTFSLTLNGVNLALIPGTATSVAINNVNQLTNTIYYRSNVLNTTPELQYDGYTTVL